MIPTCGSRKPLLISVCPATHGLFLNNTVFVQYVLVLAIRQVRHFSFGFSAVFLLDVGMLLMTWRGFRVYFTSVSVAIWTWDYNASACWMQPLKLNLLPVYYCMLGPGTA